MMEVKQSDTEKVKMTQSEAIKLMKMAWNQGKADTLFGIVGDCFASLNAVVSDLTDQLESLKREEARGFVVVRVEDLSRACDLFGQINSPWLMRLRKAVMEAK